MPIRIISRRANAIVALVGSSLLVGALLAALLAPSALASSHARRHGKKAAAKRPVTVRILGPAPTYKLLRLSRVSLTSKAVARYGGSCTGDSAAGALQQATGGRWEGAWSSSFGDYEVTGIEGVRLAFEPGAAANWYWSVWLDGREATAGVCELVPKPGETLLFVPSCYGKSCPSAPKIGKGALSIAGIDVKRSGRYAAAGAPRDLSGSVSSSFQVTHVSVALSRIYVHRCYALRSSAALRPSSCRLSFVKAKVRATPGGARFSLKLPRALPAGRYLLSVRAGDVAGDSAPTTKVRFSVR